MYIWAYQYLQGGAAEIFKDLEMIMIIDRFKRMFILIEDRRNLGSLQSVCHIKVIDFSLVCSTRV